MRSDRRFWVFGASEERRIVRSVLYRRFPHQVRILADTVPAVFDLDLAHPGNPDGDNEAILEILALLAGVGGDLTGLPPGRLLSVLGEGLTRSSGHKPDPARLLHLHHLVSAAAASIDWPAVVWDGVEYEDGTPVPEDEKAMHPPFWPTGHDLWRWRRQARTVLVWRFPETATMLSVCLEQADPHGMVYPDQGNEYFYVVREAMVLLSPESCDLDLVSAARLRDVLDEALARCFGEPPEKGTVEHAVQLIQAKHELLHRQLPG